MSIWNLGKESALIALLMDGSGVSVYLTFVFMAVATFLVLYLLTRFLYWSGKKTLPGTQSSAFNIVLVSLVTLIAMLSLVGIDPIRVFSLIMEEILSIPQDAGYVAWAIFGAVSLILFVFAQRVRRT
jgi:hypothetical protein